MPGDPLASVVRGSQLPRSAATWNPILAAAREFQQGSRPDRELARLQSSGCVEAVALNDTGADLDAFKPAKVSGAGGYDLTASDRVSFDWTARPALTLDVPTGPTDVVAVTLEPIPDGKFGRVAVAGWCACDVDVSSSGHGYASPTTNTTALVSGATGSVRIIATGTGTARRTQVYLGDQVAAASASTPTSVASLLSPTKNLTPGGTTTVIDLSVGAGKWSVRWHMVNLLTSTFAGENIYGTLSIAAGSGTIDDNLLGWSVTAQVAGVQAIGSASNESFVNMSSSGTVRLSAVCTAFGTVSVAQARVGTNLRATPADF